MLEVRNLAFSYRRERILRDVSFVVSPGEVVSVVGANGVGKTTLLRILATLAVPEGGMVLVDGQDALARPIRYRRMLGYLPERAALYGDLNAREYLTYRAHLKGEADRRVRRRVNEAIELCRLGAAAAEPIARLSIGFRKRVALADALLLRPRVLLLDDFLAGLDHDMRETSGAILSDAAAFSSVIVTGHETDDFARWTSRFLVLANGVISATVSTAGVAPEDLRERLQLARTGGVR